MVKREAPDKKKYTNLPTDLLSLVSLFMRPLKLRSPVTLAIKEFLIIKKIPGTAVQTFEQQLEQKYQPPIEASFASQVNSFLMVVPLFLIMDWVCIRCIAIFLRY